MTTPPGELMTTPPGELMTTPPGELMTTPPGELMVCNDHSMQLSAHSILKQRCQPLPLDLPLKLIRVQCKGLMPKHKSSQ